MNGPLRAKLLIIFGVLLWGVYSLIPTFLDESASEKLARQALEADSGPIVDDSERLPEAANLPPSLRLQVLSALTGADIHWGMVSLSLGICWNEQKLYLKHWLLGAVGVRSLLLVGSLMH